MIFYIIKNLFYFCATEGTEGATGDKGATEGTEGTEGAKGATGDIGDTGATEGTEAVTANGTDEGVDFISDSDGISDSSSSDCIPTQTAIIVTRGPPELYKRPITPMTLAHIGRISQ